jgi:hypothetical protein
MDDASNIGGNRSGSAARGLAVNTPATGADMNSPDAQELERGAVMATVLPASREQLINWFSDRAAAWAADPTAIGLTALQVSDMVSKLAASESALTDASAAKISSKDATVVYYSETDDLRSFGADLIKTIKAYAETTNDAGVYAAASVPPPLPPTPAGPPNKPNALEAELLSGGGLHLSWKGTVSQSAYFSVYRKAEGETAFTLLDSPKDKFFDDNTIPAGSNSVIYYIQARRDDFRIDSIQYTVSFGAGGTASLTMAA